MKDFKFVSSFFFLYRCDFLLNLVSFIKKIHVVDGKRERIFQFDQVLPPDAENDEVCLKWINSIF